MQCVVGNRVYAEPTPKCHFWVGHTNDGPVVMAVRNLVHLLGCRIDLHTMLGADKKDCHHTHPAWAIRIVLWNGYVEEVPPDVVTDVGAKLWNCGRYRTWKPGMVGIVRPEFAHRIDRLLKGRSVSLWIRGPVVAKVKLVGEGWNA